MAAKQREISVSEFFAKNRHLLGFDNPRKAMLITVKEAVDNALDACEEGAILPDIYVKVRPLSETRFKITVRDNGPGIVKKQIEHIFGQLLYGSKFHRMKMSRGQQGIGISAAGMYGQLTTGVPVRITSRTSAKEPAQRCELLLDMKKNEPVVRSTGEVEWELDHGTRVEIERASNRVKITIHTARPGIIIGRKGAEIESLRRDLEGKTKRQILINIEEIRKPDMVAQLVAENVANQPLYHRNVRHAGEPVFVARFLFCAAYLRPLVLALGPRGFSWMCESCRQ